MAQQLRHRRVNCKNLKGINIHELLEREYLANHLIKLEIDCGGSSLKTSLGVINTSQGIDETFSPKQKTSKLLTTSTAWDTEVKRQLIIAIAEEVPESYKNIKALLDLINISNVRFIISYDLKVANLFCGIQSTFKQTLMLLV